MRTLELRHRRSTESSPSKGSPAPTEVEYSGLKPRNAVGALFAGLCAGLTAASMALSLSQNLFVWLLGQMLLGVALLQWFVLLHEAGHKTLFRSARLNKYIGHVASFFALIPFETWKMVHSRHHYWTGWQDLDVTTAGLVDKKLGLWQKIVIRTCWKLWLPLFSVLYRLDNYWNLPRLIDLFSNRRRLRKVLWNTAILVAVYGLTVYLVGPLHLLRLAGLGLFVTLVFQDILILSQHTHIPMHVSHGAAVRPFPPLEQEVFTRSLKFPQWFSRIVLLNMDAHELHHMHTRVPGYYLHKIDYEGVNTVTWWRWVLRAKRLPGDVFLFQNRDQTGFYI